MAFESTIAVVMDELEQNKGSLEEFIYALRAEHKRKHGFDPKKRIRYVGDLQKDFPEWFREFHSRPSAAFTFKSIKIKREILNAAMGVDFFQNDANVRNILWDRFVCVADNLGRKFYCFEIIPHERKLVLAIEKPAGLDFFKTFKKELRAKGKI